MLETITSQLKSGKLLIQPCSLHLTSEWPFFCDFKLWDGSDEYEEIDIEEIADSINKWADSGDIWIEGCIESQGDSVIEFLSKINKLDLHIDESLVDRTRFDATLHCFEKIHNSGFKRISGTFNIIPRDICGVYKTNASYVDNHLLRIMSSDSKLYDMFKMNCPSSQWRLKYKTNNTIWSYNRLNEFLDKLPEDRTRKFYLEISTQ